MLPKNTEPHRAYLSRRAKDLNATLKYFYSCKLHTRSHPRVSRLATPLSRAQLHGAIQPTEGDMVFANIEDIPDIFGLLYDRSSSKT